MNQRVAAQTVCFLAQSSTLRSRHGRPQRGVCPFLALCVLAMSTRFFFGRELRPPQSWGVGVLGRASVSGHGVFRIRRSGGRFGDLETRTGTIFTAPIEFLVGTGWVTGTAPDIGEMHHVQRLPQRSLDFS